MTIFVNFPYINSTIVELYPEKHNTITVQSKNAFKMIDWANENIPEESDVIVMFEERYSKIGMYYFFPDFLRDDLHISIPSANHTFGDYAILDKDFNPYGQYILSNRMLNSGNFNQDLILEELFITQSKPHYTVYYVRYQGS